MILLLSFLVELEHLEAGASLDELLSRCVQLIRMDHKMLLTLTRYRLPPSQVDTVLKSMVFILDDSHSSSQGDPSWEVCRNFVKRDDFLQRIASFSLADMNSKGEEMKRALRLLANVNPTELKKTSFACFLLYQWLHLVTHMQQSVNTTEIIAPVEVSPEAPVTKHAGMESLSLSEIVAPNWNQSQSVGHVQIEKKIKDASKSDYVDVRVQVVQKEKQKEREIDQEKENPGHSMDSSVDQQMQQELEHLRHERSVMQAKIDDILAGRDTQAQEIAEEATRLALTELTAAFQEAHASYAHERRLRMVSEKECASLRRLYGAAQKEVSAKEEALQTMQGENDQLSQKLFVVEESRRSAESRQLAMEQGVESVKEQLQRLSKESLDVRNQLQHEIGNNKALRWALDNEQVMRATLQEQLEGSESIKVKLIEEQEQYESRIRRLERELKERDSERGSTFQLEEECGRLHQFLTETEEKKRELEDCIFQKDNEIRQLQPRIASGEESLREAQVLRDELATNWSQSQATVAALQTELQAALQDGQVIRAREAAGAREIRSLRERLQQKEALIEQMEEQLVQAGKRSERRVEEALVEAGKAAQEEMEALRQELLAEGVLQLQHACQEMEQEHHREVEELREQVACAEASSRTAHSERSRLEGWCKGMESVVSRLVAEGGEQRQVMERHLSASLEEVGMMGEKMRRMEAEVVRLEGVAEGLEGKIALKVQALREAGTQHQLLAQDLAECQGALLAEQSVGKKQRQEMEGLRRQVLEMEELRRQLLKMEQTRREIAERESQLSTKWEAAEKQWSQERGILEKKVTTAWQTSMSWKEKAILAAKEREQAANEQGRELQSLREQSQEALRRGDSLEREKWHLMQQLQLQKETPKVVVETLKVHVACGTEIVGVDAASGTEIVGVHVATGTESVSGEACSHCEALQVRWDTFMAELSALAQSLVGDVELFRPSPATDSGNMTREWVQLLEAIRQQWKHQLAAVEQSRVKAEKESEKRVASESAKKKVDNEVQKLRAALKAELKKSKARQIIEHSQRKLDREVGELQDALQQEEKQRQQIQTTNTLLKDAIEAIQEQLGSLPSKGNHT